MSESMLSNSVSKSTNEDIEIKVPGGSDEVQDVVETDISKLELNEGIKINVPEDSDKVQDVVETDISKLELNEGIKINVPEDSDKVQDAVETNTPNPSERAILDNVLNTTKSGNGSFVQPISQQELPTESGWASALKSYASQLYNTPLYFYLFCATVSILAIGFAVVHCRRHKTHRKLWASIVSYFRASWPECREKAGRVLSEKYQEGFVFTCVATLCLLWHMLLDLGVAPVFYLFGGILYPKFARFVTLCSDLVLSRTSPKPKRLFPHVMNIKVDGRRFGRNGKYVGYQNFDMMNGGHQDYQTE